MRGQDILQSLFLCTSQEIFVSNENIVGHCEFKPVRKARGAVHTDLTSHVHLLLSTNDLVFKVGIYLMDQSGIFAQESVAICNFLALQTLAATCMNLRLAMALLIFSMNLQF